MPADSTTSAPPAARQAGAAPAGKPAAPAKQRSILGRLILWGLLIVVLVAGGLYGFRWWTVGRFVESTNDAYLAADSVAVAPKVSGYVGAVLIKDNQAVQAGQALVRIDPENYHAALAQQRATYDARMADIAASEARVQQQLATVQQAEATLAGAVVSARFAESQAERYRHLASNGVETAEQLAEMINNRDQANATVASDQAALIAAERQVDTLKTQVAQSRAQAEAGQAAVQSADLDVQNTLIRASIAGRVGDRTVRPGQYVQPGTRLLSIVPVEGIYVLANFKETQIGGMRVGQKADISVDALDGRVIHGVVDSFAPGTGAQFALLPPENATGNFTKIVQRVPVRLRLETDDKTLQRLLPGLSVTVSIDTRDGAR